MVVLRKALANYPVAQLGNLDLGSGAFRLAKAFRGELVPTEFELAKAEGRSFESAEELLDRIKRNGHIEEAGKKQELQGAAPTRDLFKRGRALHRGRPTP